MTRCDGQRTRPLCQGFAMPRLAAGDTAPDFKLPDQDGVQVSLPTSAAKRANRGRWSSTSTRQTTPPAAPRRPASSTRTSTRSQT